LLRQQRLDDGDFLVLFGRHFAAAILGVELRRLAALLDHLAEDTDDVVVAYALAAGLPRGDVAILDGRFDQAKGIEPASVLRGESLPEGAVDYVTHFQLRSGGQDGSATNARKPHTCPLIS